MVTPPIRLSVAKTAIATKPVILGLPGIALKSVNITSKAPIGMTYAKTARKSFFNGSPEKKNMLILIIFKIMIATFALGKPISTGIVRLLDLVSDGLSGNAVAIAQERLVGKMIHNRCQGNPASFPDWA